MARTCTLHTQWLEEIEVDSTCGLGMAGNSQHPGSSQAVGQSSEQGNCSTTAMPLWSLQRGNICVMQCSCSTRPRVIHLQESANTMLKQKLVDK